MNDFFQFFVIRINIIFILNITLYSLLLLISYQIIIIQIIIILIIITLFTNYKHKTYLIWYIMYYSDSNYL